MNPIKAFLKSFVINLQPGEKSIFSSESLTGVYVNEETALSNVTVYACIRLLSETLASLPLVVYKRNGKGKIRATEHPLYTLLHNQPNPEMNSLTLRETLMSHLLTWGNAYAQIDWEDYTHIKALWPLFPNRVRKTRDPQTKQIIYHYTPSDGSHPVDLPAWRVLHIPGLGFDGLVGYAPITMARNTIGLAQATEEFGSRFFKNGINPSGILEHPSKMSDTAYKNLKESFTNQYAGLGNSNKPIILEEGAKFNKISVSPEDAQFLETRKFQRSEIASFFHVPPHMIGDLERSTNNNIEQQSLEFVIYTMRPWLVRWEQAINTQLLTEDERSDYFAEFLVEGLLRGSPVTRASFYKELFYLGALSPNDIREKENLDPITDPGGDKYYVQANMVPMDMTGKVPVVNPVNK